VIELRLEELLSKGATGVLRRGALRQDIECVLGAPTDLGGTSRKYPKPAVLKYGDLELLLEKGGNNSLSAVKVTVRHGGAVVENARKTLTTSLFSDFKITESVEHLEGWLAHVGITSTEFSNFSGSGLILASRLRVYVSDRRVDFIECRLL
jgi:hypothetical protein